MSQQHGGIITALGCGNQCPSYSQSYVSAHALSQNHNGYDNPRLSRGESLNSETSIQRKPLKKIIKANTA